MRIVSCARHGFDKTGNPLNFHAAVLDGVRQHVRAVLDQDSARFDRRRGTQQIMLRRRPKTVESCRAAAPNRDNTHFGDA
ncbi:hypothetical protein WK67_01060 [Burkholderia ubonensis]|uniref:Uncharacterized protein n=1 Tax=Burkholderia ubonensis TaxID=101571 RepID=A0AAU8U710_9BURK|nr:hypothetical protein [Burkholderia ubonensis]AOK21397.1 hypothetical protein WK67_01060 [Burkholderia ubonensis]